MGPTRRGEGGRREEEGCCATGPMVWLGRPFVEMAHTAHAGREKGRWREGGGARVGPLLRGLAPAHAGKKGKRRDGLRLGQKGRRKGDWARVLFS